MSAREAKNPATMQFTKIDDLAKVETKDNNEIDVNVNVNDETNKETGTPSSVAADPMAALKAKMQASKAKESNKQVTVYLTPENYKRFNKLKEKGQKSELINQLLDIYFDE